MSAPYYVAVYGGFLVVEYYNGPLKQDGYHERLCKAYTIADVRSATPWNGFELADAAAKWAVNHLYPPDLRYFAILAAPTNLTKAPDGQ